jgi:hypothetical protein
MIIVKLVSWLYFGVGYRIIIWCFLLVGGLVVWTLWWWAAMRCHLIKQIWFNLFQIDSSILTIRNSYALQWRSLRIAVKDWHWVLTDELVWSLAFGSMIQTHSFRAWSPFGICMRCNGGRGRMGSYDRGNSGLMFHKEDLPSSKKEEKLRCCLFGMILN